MFQQNSFETLSRQRTVKNGTIECRMLRMSGSEELTEGPEEPQRMRLEQELREVDQQLRREMRARGFDPDQDDHVALTAPLAKLYTERELLREKLELLSAE